MLHNEIDNTRYDDREISAEMQDSFLDYAMSVIVSRALPNVRDGLKPVHRRILYTMYERGLDSTHEYKKSADTVGAVLGSYHPHGDSSVYGAMVRLAQDFSLRYPLIDGQGNFGSVDGDPPAAYRYTEARMKKISDEMLRGIEKETVDFVPNYNEDTTEPSVLPSRIPNILINGSTGIAVGMATNIPPHNLSEVCDGIVYLIDNPDCTYRDLMEKIPGPDFPTGGIIMGRSGIRSAYATGRGKITLRSKYTIEEKPNGRQQIIVNEIPYMVNKAELIKRIADLVKDKRVDGIADLNDESDREGMRIVIELKKDANAQIVLNHLFSLSQLQDTVGVIMLALDDGVPKIMDLKTMLKKYVSFQEEVLTREAKFDLKKALEREHLLEGMKIACDNIDEVIHIIRNSYDNAKEKLMERFGLSEIQANAILNMQLRRLQGLEREKIEAELARLAEKIDYLQKFLADETMVLSKVKEDIIEIKEKYGDERKTEIQTVSGEVDIEDLIPNDENVFTFTNAGYIKRQSKENYQVQRRGGRGISASNNKEDDYIKELFLCRTHNYIMLASNMGRVYRMKGYEVPEGSRQRRGSNIVNFLPLLPGEVITSVIPTEAKAEGSYLVMVTKKGIIKRTPLNRYANVKKTGLIAINLDEGDDLAWTMVTHGNDYIIVATKNGQAIRFSENDVRVVGRTARGVKAIELNGDDEVVGMGIAKSGTKILTVTEDGKGRITSADEYRIQFRGGMGVKNFDVDKYGKVCGVGVVNDDDDIIIISMNGIIIRMKANEINQQSRYAGGVKVMRLDENDRAVTFAVTMSDDEVENARPTSEELPDDEKEADGNSVMEEDLIRDYDAEEEELVQQSADEDIE